jgi:hypothetical protein
VYKAVRELNQTRLNNYAYLRQFSTQTKQSGTGTATARHKNGSAVLYNEIRLDLT